jgi:dipeptidyl aminopeptidase/acylaminoacyl peptidase
VLNPGHRYYPIEAFLAKGALVLEPNYRGSAGYISAFLATHTERFKAISVGAGISDWTTYYVNTDITPFTRQYLKATPWDDPEIYARSITKPKSNRAVLQHNLDWFSHYVWGEPIPSDSPLRGRGESEEVK